MTFALALKLYGCANLLLIASYGVYRLLRGSRLRLRHGQWILLSQLLIGLSVIAPPALHLMPSKTFPRIDWLLVRPFSEGARSGASVRRSAKRRTRVSSQPDLLSTPQVSEPSQLPLAAALAFVLGLGVLFAFARLFRSLHRLHATLRSATCIRKLGRVRVAVSGRVGVPFSARSGRISWVILPEWMLVRAGDLRLAMRHEIQHHRQGDTSWAVCVEALLCAFFANPALYAWKREITELQEFSCDEALISRKGVSSRDYGSCLVRVAEAALGSRAMYVGTTCMAAISRNPDDFKSLLRRRVEMFTSESRLKISRGSFICAGTLAAFLVVALAFGAEQSFREDPQPGPNPGVATVDPAVQQIAERVLSDALHSEKARSGFAVVAEPQTGRVLAVANLDTENARPGHWALAQVFYPASIAKALVVAQAMNDGLTEPGEVQNCEHGSYRYGDRVYHDWKEGGWDHLTTEGAIVHSSDICTMKVGEKIGAEGLQKMLVNFGFGPGGSTQSFPEARAGILPPTDNPLYPTIVPGTSAGFGYRISPLEMVQAYGAIANGGVLLEPKMADADSSPQVVRRVLTPEAAAKTREILRQVVLKGTGKGHANSEVYSTAGKTATSFFPDSKSADVVTGGVKANFAAFIGFAPVNNPRVEVYVGIVDPQTDPKGGAHGGMHAGPVFKRIAEEVLQHFQVPPDLGR